MASDKELLAEAKEHIQKLTAELERIASAAMPRGMVVAREDGKLYVSIDGKVLAIEDDKKSKIGAMVLVHPMTMQIVAQSAELPIGLPATISHVTDFGVEISGAGGSHFLCNTVKGLEKGDRVLVDPSQTVVLSLIEKAPLPAFAPTVSAVKWNDVGGHTEAKQLLRDAVELPRKHPDIFAHFNKKPARGILLAGPPGCGKTLLARAVATSVGADEGGFLAIKGPEVLDPYVGVTEQTIRGVFRSAAEYKLTHGREAVVFIDEAESLLAKRGTHGNYMGQTVVPTFLTEMDGLEESCAIVILATNRADILDPAILRDGRIDHKIEIARPTEEDAKAIFTLYLKPVPFKSKMGLDGIASSAANMLYQQDFNVLPKSGALIEGIVKKATDFAIRRAISTKTMGEMCQDDLIAALSLARAQEMSLQPQKEAA